MCSRIWSGYQKAGGCGVKLGLLLCIVLAQAGISRMAYADPVVGEIFPLHQPDGTRVDVRVWGDEFYRIVESMDGYTLMREPTSGVTCYAQLSRDRDELVSTGVPVEPIKPARLDLERHIRIRPVSAKAKIAAAHARLAEEEAEVLASLRGKAAPAGPPNNGDVQGIVLLVDFDDQVGTILPSEIYDYCNEPGYSGFGNNGSVRDYFYDVSDGHLTYTNFVPSTYYRANELKSWYDDPNFSCCNRARGLVLEALNDLDDQGFDFSQYDSNDDGLVDAVNVFYAGTRNGPWSYGLWPHSWSVSFAADSVSTRGYQITDIGNQLRLRTFCHENGHMICYWPDLYDYGYESNGVGNFCLMCYGASDTNPAEPSAYMKFIAGWTDTTILTAPQAGLPAPAGINTLYKYEHPTAANEYYLIENRQKTGRDTYIPDSGLAIWHVDEFGSNDYEQQTPELHYEVTLVQADGDWDLENAWNYGDSTDLWAAPYYMECGPETDPNTSWWDGSESGLHVTEISSSGSTMTFDFSQGGDCNGNGVPDDEDIIEGTSLDEDENGVPDECECAWTVDPLQPEPAPTAKNRSISVVPGNPGQQTALRVTLVDLPAPFEAYEGDIKWIGPPSQVSEAPGSSDPTPGPTFTAASLQCSPYYTDWSTAGLLHVVDAAIVPAGYYKVQAIHQDCDLVGEPNYSAALAVEATPLWGDLVGNCGVTPCTGPDGKADFLDIAAIVDKFKGAVGAPLKARADLGPNIPDRVIDFVDIQHAVAAFRSSGYPFGGPTACP